MLRILLSIAKSEHGPTSMYRDMVAAIAVKSVHLSKDKLRQ